MNKHLSRWALLTLCLLLSLAALAGCVPATEVTQPATEPAPAGDSEQTAQRFLELLLGDDRELQQAILEHTEAVSAAMIDPDLAQRQALLDAAARLEELQRDRFGSLLSETLLEKRIRDGSLLQYQRLLAGAGATAILSDYSFSGDPAQLEYTARVAVTDGALGQSVTIQGELGLDGEGRIDFFEADSSGQLSRALTQLGSE